MNGFSSVVCFLTGERAEGAEVKPEPSTNISSQKSSRLEKTLRSLSLQTADDDNDSDTHPFNVTSNTAAVLLLNSV